jgi:hypothetical protein
MRIERKTAGTPEKMCVLMVAKKPKDITSDPCDPAVKQRAVTRI